MHVLWLILKGAGLFFAIPVVFAVGAAYAQPKAIKEKNKLSATLLPMWPGFALGTVAVIGWGLGDTSGWIILGLGVAAGFLLGWIGERMSWSRMTPEKSAAWLTKIKNEEQQVRQASEAKKKLAKEENARRAKEERAWRPVIAALEAKDPALRAKLTFPVPFELPSGATAFGTKVLSGLLSGGMDAVTEDRFLLDTIRLPESCCLCGLFPGTAEKSASCQFQRGSALSGLVGVNLNAQLTLNYKVCSHCDPRPETALHLTQFVRKETGWEVSLSVLNTEVAQRIAGLNRVAKS